VARKTVDEPAQSTRFAFAPATTHPLANSRSAVDLGCGSASPALSERWWTQGESRAALSCPFQRFLEGGVPGNRLRAHRPYHLEHSIEPAPLEIRLCAGFHRLGQIVTDAVALFVNSLAPVGTEWTVHSACSTRADALQTRYVMRRGGMVVYANDRFWGFVARALRWS
jgi:hypothetical protein